MRFRPYIAALMILLSLTAQARTAFACAMMPGAAMAHCCCSREGKDHCPEVAARPRCCDVVAPADAPLAHALTTVGAHHARFGAIDSPPLAAVNAYLLPAAFDTGDQSQIRIRPGTDRYPVRPHYLLTARLRL